MRTLLPAPGQPTAAGGGQTRFPHLWAGLAGDDGRGGEEGGVAHHRTASEGRGAGAAGGTRPAAYLSFMLHKWGILLRGQRKLCTQTSGKDIYLTECKSMKIVRV